MSIDKKYRHRGKDEGDAPLLRDGEGASADGDVVIGGEQGDQAEGKAAYCLGETDPVEAEPIQVVPGAGLCW
ncbi:MAG: hypothetical protein NTZ40_00660 [Cyanobacteria bacterium]|nr:hypothetical protein [Cyanobacteriota bacterium]